MKGRHTDNSKRLQPLDELILHILRGVGVVIRAKRVLKEGNLVLGRV